MHQEVKKMILEICQKAKSASAQLAKASTEQRNRALYNMANSLERNCTTILDANMKDVEAARGSAGRNCQSVVLIWYSVPATSVAEV